MVNLTNVAVPSVANQAFVPLAVEAGIEAVIASLVPLAKDKRTLLVELVGALENTNPALAAALNMDTLDAILRFMASKAKAPVVLTRDLPETVHEAGPASVSAARDGGDPTQVNVTFSEPPAGYKYAIYVDAVLSKVGSLAADSGWVNEAVTGVPDDGQAHTVRVLFITPENHITLFGPIAYV